MAAASPSPRGPRASPPAERLAPAAVEDSRIAKYVVLPFRRLLLVLGVMVLAQVIVFYDHFAVSLTFLFGIGLGVWLRHWSAGIYAAAAFLPAFGLAILIGWLHDARLWELPFGLALAFTGGAIGGGIFQLLRMESGWARAAEEDDEG